MMRPISHHQLIGISIMLALIWPITARENMSEAQLRRGFAHPPKSARPLMRWWWPGGDVTDDELSREIRALDAAGFYGGEIQSFTFGLPPVMSPDRRRRIDDIFTPTWFAHLQHVVREAHRRGCVIDLTFGSGWPFGGAFVPPNLSEVELVMAGVSLRGPQSYDGPIPWPPPADTERRMIALGLTRPSSAAFKRRMAKLEKVVAVLAVRGSSPVIETSQKGRRSLIPPRQVVEESGRLEMDSVIDLTDRVTAARRLKWNVPAGEWQLFTFVQRPTDQRVLGGAGGGEQLVVNHMDRRAMSFYLQWIGGRLQSSLNEELGKGLRAIFCDSLEVTSYLFWSDDFLQQFRRRRGYDLKPFLPLLRKPGVAEPYGSYQTKPLYDAPGIGDRIRHDYWQTVSDLWIERFFMPLIAWAHRHGLLARIQPHGAPADVLRVAGLADIPESEDLYDWGRYDFLKFISSGAHLYGRRLVANESFVRIPGDYETTPEMMKIRGDELFAAGINEIIMHGMPYEYMDRPEPGWYPFSSPYTPFSASSHFGPHTPFWAHFPLLNAYFTRLQFVFQNGHTVAPVALYSHRLDYPNRARPRGQEPEIVTALLEHGYDFDYMNEYTLVHHSRILNRQLVTPGRRYRVLLFVGERRLDLALVEKLHAFARAGLPILFVGVVPGEEIGFLNYEERGKRIRRLVRDLFGGRPLSTLVHRSHLRVGRTLFVKDVRQAVQLLSDRENGLGIPPTIRFARRPHGIGFLHVKAGGMDFYFLHNATRDRHMVNVAFPEERRVPEIWNPWDGHIVPAPQYHVSSDGTSMSLRLKPYQSILIGFGTGKRLPHIIQSQLSTVRREGNKLMGIAYMAGTYRTTLSSGREETITIQPGEIPAPRRIEGTWHLRAIGRDKRGQRQVLTMTLKRLKDWTELTSLKYFSGEGHYVIDFTLDSTCFRKDLGVELDLGQLHDVATVRINGRGGMTLLLRPYRVDVTNFLRPGENRLEVVITTTLRNRLLGDALAGDRYFMPIKKRPHLLPSGLVGPVRLIFYKRVRLL
ncbi:MAG: hypothetical protein D6723_13715 [Acidobacteria bacterium]|nr:MAG: hypothetical protein D6723_13715 [Acidobacteriota bacterium]